MSTPDELEALVAEYKGLELPRDSARAKTVLARAAALVDRAAQPKRWAAMRGIYGDLCQNDDPPAALAAYRDALTVWQPADDRDPWTHCQGQLGFLLATTDAAGAAGGDEAIACLERAVGDHPFWAQLLARLYGVRPDGDPHENWARRVRYLALALAQVEFDSERDRWATLSNELACARAEEPGADYAALLETRLAAHATVLGTLQPTDAPFCETCLMLATAYLDRVGGDQADNATRARAFATRALDVLTGAGRHAQEIEALLLLARGLTFKPSTRRAKALVEALGFIDRAGALAIRSGQRVMLGNVEKQRALNLLELLRLGEAQRLEAFVTACETALQCFDGPTYLDERRKLLQVQVDGLFEAGDHARARPCGEAAVAVVESLIAQATTTPGRLERIWQLRDSTGLLACSCVALGDLPAAVEALDRGKARLWDRGERGPAPGALVALIPAGGALLMPVFAAPEGLVIVAMRDGANVRLDVVRLPHFGKARVLALQRGASPSELGGWLLAYMFRNSRPDAFAAQIDAIGRVLAEELWSVVLPALAALGLTDGAPLVWLPHGGIGALPVHAAWWPGQGRRHWLVEHHALRYAPSLGLLAADARAAAPPASIAVIGNPTGDLDFSALECEWIEQSCAGAALLAGEQATRAAVLEAFRAHPRVHIASHAGFDIDDPFASSIQLAGGERLTLAELAPQLTQQPPQVVFLSACETAVARVTSLAEEFLGFPAALLAHGVRTVVASQWPVDDVATAFLVGRFYRERATGADEAESLRRAQNWLREAGIGELSALLRGLRGSRGAVGAVATRALADWRGRPRRERPFAHPQSWAAFTVSGGG